jgi:hypothetical protein
MTIKSKNEWYLIKVFEYIKAELKDQYDSVLIQDGIVKVFVSDELAIKKMQKTYKNFRNRAMKVILRGMGVKFDYKIVE